MKMRYSGRQRRNPETSEKQVPRRPPFTFTKCSVASDRHVERNEDSVVVDQRRGLAAVFDGVGGSAAGEVASQIAAHVIRRGWKRFLQQLQVEHNAPTMLENSDSVDLRSTLLHFVEEAHEQIRAEGARRVVIDATQPTGSEDQATTIALAVFCRQKTANGYTMVYASVGDSRIYLLRGAEALKRLTQDDGYLTKLVQNAVISENDALRIDQATHAEQLSETELTYFNKRNGITQALGDPQPPLVHIDQVSIFPGDRILLCSDGIHDNLTDDQIEDMLRWGARTRAVRLIVQSAVKGSQQDSSITMRAKPDDMSAIVITCNGWINC